MKKLNILLVVMIISLSVMNFMAYRGLKTKENLTEEKTNIVTKVVTKPETKIETKPEVKTSDYPEVEIYNKEAKTMKNNYDVKEAERVANSMLTLHRFRNYKEYSDNFKNNFVEDMKNMYVPGGHSYEKIAQFKGDRKIDKYAMFMNKSNHDASMYEMMIVTKSGDLVNINYFDVAGNDKLKFNEAIWGRVLVNDRKN